MTLQQHSTGMSSFAGIAKYILPLLLLSISCMPALASSIVVMRNADEIVIGTDSRRISAPGEDLRYARTELVCKIVRADNIFIASAGIAGIIPDSPHGEIPPEFDLAKIMNKAALGKRNILDKADTVTKAVQSILLKISWWAKEKKPALFKKMFIGKELLQVVMAGMENDSPTIIVIAFKPRISASGELKIDVEYHPCPGIACPEGSVYILMGKHEAIDRYLPQTPAIWKNDSVEVVRKLLEIEVAAERETVGPPIDILRISKNGSEWIQRKEMCAEQSQPGITPDNYQPFASPPDVLQSP
jgi:hypothetical protein